MALTRTIDPDQLTDGEKLAALLAALRTLADSHTAAAATADAMRGSTDDEWRAGWASATASDHRNIASSLRGLVWSVTGGDR